MENMLRGSLTSTTDAKGVLGFKGERGYSAYEIAVQHGFEGTEEDWLATLGTSSHFSKDVAIYETSASTTEFNTPITVATGDFVDVYINGFKLNENEYTFDISKVTLTNPVLSGNTVEVIVNRMSTNNLPISSTIGYSSTNDTAAGSKAVYDYVQITNDNVGDLEELTTTDKTSIVDAINEVNSGVNANDVKGTYYEYLLPRVTSTLGTLTWYTMASDVTTTTLPKGDYLFLFKGAVGGTSSTTNVCTIEPSIDGSGVNSERLSIPTNSYASAFQIWKYKSFSTDATHVLNCKGWSNSQFNVNQDLVVTIFRIK